MNKILACLILMMIPACLAAQTTREFGPATGGQSVPWPFDMLSIGRYGVRYQHIYSAAELNLGRAAVITRIRVKVDPAYATTFTLTNFQLRMARTPLAPDALTANLDPSSTGGPCNYTLGTMRTCIGPGSYTPVYGNGFITFVLSQPYYFDGTANLLVDWSYGSFYDSGARVFAASDPAGVPPALRKSAWTGGHGMSQPYIHLEPVAQVHAWDDFRLQFVFSDLPVLTVDVPWPPTPHSVYANEDGGGAGYKCGAFELTNSSASQAITASAITVRSGGTADDAAAFSSVALWHDTNDNGAFDAAGDTLLGTAAAFPVDNGALTFALPASLQMTAPGGSSRFLLVVKWNGTCPPGKGFEFSVDAVATVMPVAYAPSAAFSTVIVLNPRFQHINKGPAARQTVVQGASGIVMQQFEIFYPGGLPNTETGLTFVASGSGDDTTGYTALRLCRDSNSSGAYEAGTDALIDTRQFSANDGALQFTLSGGEEVFAAGDRRLYFVVADFATPAPGDTFATQLTATTGAAAATMILGVPMPFGGAAPGVIIGNGPFVVSTSTLAAAIEAHAYSESIVLSGGTAPYLWSLLGSSLLPAGVTLDTTTTGPAASLSGTPTQVGQFPVDVEVTDAFGLVAQGFLVLDVVAFTPLAIQVLDNPVTFERMPYIGEFLATGGSGMGHSWSIDSGNLPPGIAGLPLAGASQLTLAGICDAAGLYPCVLRLEDSDGNVATLPLTVEIIAPPPVVSGGKGGGGSGGCAATGGSGLAAMLVIALLGALAALPRLGRRATGCLCTLLLGGLLGGCAGGPALFESGLQFHDPQPVYGRYTVEVRPPRWQCPALQEPGQAEHYMQQVGEWLGHGLREPGDPARPVAGIETTIVAVDVPPNPARPTRLTARVVLRGPDGNPLREVCYDALSRSPGGADVQGSNARTLAALDKIAVGAAHLAMRDANQ